MKVAVTWAFCIQYTFYERLLRSELPILNSDFHSVSTSGLYLSINFQIVTQIT